MMRQLAGQLQESNPMYNSPKRGSSTNSSSWRHDQNSNNNGAKRSPSAPTKVDWHADIHYAVKSGKWEHVRGQLSLLASYQNSQNVEGEEQRKKGKLSFLRLISGRAEKESSGLLVQDGEGRTPLHLALTSRKTPNDILLSMVSMEPKAASVRNSKKRLPLHFAVAHQHHIEVIAELVEAYPPGLSALDAKGQSPLSYAVDMAKKETDLESAPDEFWMPAADNTEEAIWQEEQAQRWGIAHWLLLSSATHPQTNLSVGGKKPMLVDALLYAAPPAVVSLLIGASVMLLSYENKATAFAGSTMYTTITRHYPLSILMSLASQCPKDVRKVRDETGMGLVAAQFLSGCFKQSKSTQEWTLAEEFYEMLVDSIEEGELEDDPAFIEWWRKIEFLIHFCSKRERPGVITKEHLLHTALRNLDTPPAVIRVLIALYPESLALPDPETKALPIHLAAQYREYVPRNYEYQITGTETALDILLEADPSCVTKRFESRLPLHFALESGRLMSAVDQLIRIDPSTLGERDPKTGLYPFQLCASYANNSDEDSYRWTCKARNKYSYAVWKGLSDRQKASAVIKVAEAEDLERVESIFEMIRRYPQSLTRKPTKNESGSSTSDSDARGVGLVASHYLTWCFRKIGSQAWEMNQANLEILGKALSIAKRTSSLESATSEFDVTEFDAWWSTMKSLLWSCCPDVDSILGTVPKNFLPEKDERFLLHAALLNVDTPPPVIGLLLALYPDSINLAIPGTSAVPLHIACWTVQYSARPFEPSYETTLELVLEANPEAVRTTCNNRLPLHIAIHAGKTIGELSPLVSKDPSMLGVCDPETNLLPFQLMAIRRNLTSNHQLRFHYLARNQFSEEAWDQQTPRERAQNIRREHKQYNLRVLDCVFELLRRNAAVITTGQKRLNDVETIPQKTRSTSDSSDVPSLELSESSGPDQESFHLLDSTSRFEIASNKNTNGEKTSSLVRLLSRAKQSRDNNDMFECDASVFSNVDVMSTLSSTLHTHPDARKTMRAGDFASSHRRLEEESVTLRELDESQTGSMLEFADDSDDFLMADSSGTSFAGPVVADDPPTVSEEDEVDDGSGDESDGDESYIIFQLRRKTRTAYWNEREKDAVTAVKLSKKPSRPLLQTISSNKFDEQVPPKPARPIPHVKSFQSIKQSLHSTSAYSDSYSSLHTDDLLGQGGSKPDMMWVSTQIYESNLLDYGDSNATSEDSFLLNSPVRDRSPSRSAPLEKAVDMTTETSLDETSGVKYEEDNEVTGGESWSPRRKVDPLWDPVATTPRRQTGKLDKVEISAPPVYLPADDDSAKQEELDMKQENNLNESQIYFDKVSMRWVRSEPGERKARIVKAPTKSIPEGNGSTKWSGHADVLEEIYFDRHSMRWKTRKVPTTGDDQDGQNSEKTGRLAPVPEVKAPDASDEIASSPIRQTLSREENRMRNRRYSKALHASLTLKGEMCKSSLQRDTRNWTPPDRDMRNRWSLMFRSSSRQLICVCCQENSRQILFLPCRHIAVCRNCSDNKTRHCPLCSVVITSRMAIY